MALPLGEQAGEPAEQEVARAAGRIDHPDLAEAELPDRGVERPVQDERLDELGRLEEGIALARRLGQVLVEVAEEARAPVRVGEVVDEPAGVGVHALEEGEQGHGTIARERQAEERVVAPVEQAGHARQRRRLVEAGEQILEVRIVRARAEVGVVAIAGEVQALP